jgi:hypothetical protein
MIGLAATGGPPAKGEFDFTQLAPSVADADPTGLLDVVNAFDKPICGR